MKRIVKSEEPAELRRWKEENAETPQNLIYSNMPTAAVKAQMLAEQGHLCAYTMQTINSTEDCHIEHVIPQRQPNQPTNSAIDYRNLLACFPGRKPPAAWNPQYPYGAQRKGGTHVHGHNFVSPLQEDVEHRFHYTFDGSVKPAIGDGAAASTITILRLDHEQLVDLRKAAIEERVLDANLNSVEADALSAEIMTKNALGRFPAFCLAIAQVAAWYADKARKADQAGNAQ